MSRWPGRQIGMTEMDPNTHTHIYINRSLLVFRSGALLVLLSFILLTLDIELDRIALPVSLPVTADTSVQTDSVSAYVLQDQALVGYYNALGDVVVKYFTLESHTLRILTRRQRALERSGRGDKQQQFSRRIKQMGLCLRYAAS